MKSPLVEGIREGLSFGLDEQIAVCEREIRRLKGTVRLLKAIRGRK